MVISAIRPSWHTGYARNASESKHPGLWRGKVGHWVPSLGNTGLGLLRDISGNRNHGTLTGSMTMADWLIGRNGYALDLDGTDDHVSVDGLVTQLANDTRGTVALWIKIAANDNDEHLVFTISRDVDGTRTEFFISIDMRSTAVDQLDVRLRLDGTDQWSNQTLDNSLDAHVGNWLHVAVVQDGISPVIYFNGASQLPFFNPDTDKTKWFKAILTDATSPADTANFGLLETNGSDVVPFAGHFDDVRIYNRALSSNEIRELFINPFADLELRRPIFKAPAVVGRTTKNTDAYPLGVNAGMSWRINTPV